MARLSWPWDAAAEVTKEGGGVDVAEGDMTGDEGGKAGLADVE